MSEAVSPKRAARWPYIIPLVIVVALGGLFAKRLADMEAGLDPSKLPTVLLDTPAPEFDLEPLPGRDDARFSTADLKGQVTMVNIWGSWCVGCLQEHPTLMEIAKSGDVVMHGIAWRDDPEKALAWLARRGDPYKKVGVDAEGRTVIAFGVTAAPETFIIDANGIIRYKHTGPIMPDDWNNKIKPLIAQLKK